MKNLNLTFKKFSNGQASSREFYQAFCLINNNVSTFLFIECGAFHTLISFKSGFKLKKMNLMKILVENSRSQLNLKKLELRDSEWFSDKRMCGCPGETRGEGGLIEWEGRRLQSEKSRTTFDEKGHLKYRIICKQQDYF